MNIRFHNVTIPDEIKDVFEAIQLSDTGVVVVVYKKPQVMRHLVANGADLLSGGPVSVGRSIVFYTDHIQPLTREQSKNIDAMIAAAKVSR